MVTDIFPAVGKHLVGLMYLKEICARS